METTETQEQDIELDIDEQNFINAFWSLAERNHEAMRANKFWDGRDAILKAAEAAGGDPLKEVAWNMMKSQIRELIISEVSEACEGDRKDLMDDKIPQFTMEEAEIADVIIRIFDYAAGCDLRVAEAVVWKMRHNLTRPPMHGKKF